MASGAASGSRIYWLAALAMVLAFVLTQMRWDGDTRPNGGPEALSALAARDDLNLLFVLIDTLRADHLGAYGYERDTSPQIARLVRTGIRFDDHLAQSSWTKTSMASLWTSLHPAGAGVLRASDALPEEAVLPAERLAEAGFRTLALWRNGWVAPTFGFDQGFESYVNPRPGPPPPGFRRSNPGVKLVGSDFDIVDSVEEILRTQGDDRWFLYLHLMDVHQYAADEASSRFGTTYRDVYDNAIHFTDRAVGRLLSMLDDRGLRDRTVVVVVSDHGEAFGEHGFEGHARDLHAEVTRTPWIIALPFRTRQALVIDEPSQNVDVWPTLFSLLGVDFDPEAVDGRSMLPWIRDALGEPGATPRADAGGPTRVAHLDRHWGRLERPSRPLVAIARGDYRLLHSPAGALLYDLRRDPFEQRPLGEEADAARARLAVLAERYLARRPVWRDAVPRVELDEMELGHLRALGYVVGD